MSQFHKNTENNQQQIPDFLKSKFTGSKLHKEKFGMDIPQDYFANSKSAILDLVADETRKTKVFYLRKPFQIAASIALLLGVIFTMQFIVNPSNDLVVDADNILVESLFVEDDLMNSFIDETIVSEIVVEAEKSEQDLENIFINSLFVEDSLLDNYTNESLLDQIVL